LDVGVQTMEIPSVDPTINKATSVHEEDTIPKVNQENTTCTIRKFMLQRHLIDILITRAGP
jgi:hypothetical protein